jgi:hypothetical protein
MEPGVLSSGFLFTKCAKIHLRASAIPKIIPRVIPSGPLLKGQGMGNEKDKEDEGKGGEK